MNTMQPKDFIYTLIGHDGDTTLELKYAPDGWQGFASNWKRDEKYHGVARKIEIPFRFVKEGAEFLRGEYAKYRTNAKTQIKIERFDRQTYTYSVCYHGEIDYSKMVDGMSVMSVDYFDVAIAELGMQKMLDAREKSTFEIALDDSKTPGVKTIRVVEPANAWQECEWDICVEDQTSINQYEADQLVRFYRLGTTDIPSRILICCDVERANPVPLPSIYANAIVKYRKGDYAGSYEARMNFLLDANIDMTGYYSQNSSAGSFCAFVGRWKVAYDGNGDEVRTFVDECKYELIAGQPERKVYEISIPLEADIDNYDADITLRFTFENRNAVPSTGQGWVTEGKLKMSCFSEPLSDPFDIRAISLYDAFKALTKKVADEDHPDGIQNPTATSDLMTIGSLKDIYLTSGDGIRGVADAVLKTSFVDFFDSLFGIYPVALFVSSAGLTIEAYEEAFKTDAGSMINLGEARSMIVKPATDRMFNQITVGSQDKDYRQSNGRFEFNTENYFTGGLLRVSNHASLVGKYRTDSFGVTDIRLSFVKQTTAAGDADNDVFFIHAAEKDVATPAGSVSMLVPFGELGHIVGDDKQKLRFGIFNVWLSPKRCLMRHGRIISGVLQGTSGRLTFETTGKTDARLVSKLPEYGETEDVTEREGYAADLSNPVWLPEIYEIECKIPRDLYAEIEGKPGGCFQFSFRGTTYRGFPLEIRQEHLKNLQQTIKLLAAPL